MRLEREGRERTAVTKSTYFRGTKTWKWRNIFLASIVIPVIAADVFFM